MALTFWGGVRAFLTRQEALKRMTSGQLAGAHTVADVIEDLIAGRLS
jgi:hypothetical protein